MTVPGMCGFDVTGAEEARRYSLSSTKKDQCGFEPLHLRQASGFAGGP